MSFSRLFAFSPIRRATKLKNLFSTSTPTTAASASPNLRSMVAPSYPTTVEAIAIQKTGGIDVLEKLTLPFPEVKPDHVVIKVEYLGVNFIDTYFRQGLYPLAKFPAALGKESAGIIIGLPTDEAVLNHPAYKERKYKVGGKVAVDFLGAHSTYISVPWKTVYPVPDSIPTRVAAAAVLQALTVLTFIEEAYKVKAGDIILVHTVAGGLGLLFTQLIKARGGTVIGTTSTPEKAELAKAHGADDVILYKSEDTVQRVLDITNGEGVHAVFDGVGKDTFDNNFKLIRRKGTIVSVGNASGAVAPFAPLKLVEKNVTLLRPTMSNYCFTPEECNLYGSQIWPLIESGTLKINIHQDYPFTAEGAKQAQLDLTGGKTTGKLVIDVSRS